MSQPAPATIMPRHYQAICGLALVAIFLAQFQQNIEMLINMSMLFIGAVSLLFRTRFSPLIVFLAIAAGQLLDHHRQNQFFTVDFRSFQFLDIDDMLLCLASLTYFAGVNRLHGLWFHIFPYDVRLEPAAGGKPDAGPSPQARSEQSLSQAELGWLLIPIPLFAMAAEFFALSLRQHWELVGLPPRWRQFLTIVWLILLVAFVAAHVFQYWRRIQMTHGEAQLLLHDVLWRETRGEQRRINRWIVWRNLRRQYAAYWSSEKKQGDP